MDNGTTVGQIELDLLLNSASFKTQLQNAVNSAVKQTSQKMSGTVTSSFSKLGKMAVAAFSVKAITGFISSSIELGSTLQEVQNVVDSTFTTMSKDVNKFAKSAIKNYGLSESITKKYVGTMGAMAKSFKFTEKEAYEMSTTLTGLIGDVSSFYNLDADTAYTKLKSVFTGETEALKDLGIVMTQAALDEYALSKGMGKTTAAMSEQEKVALRYSFVQDQLKTATGDFIRTQKGWANQTRILSLQWESFKANLGQAFISLLTPVIQMLNLLIEKLVTASAAFKSFIEGIFGAQEASGGGTVSEEVGSITEGIENATDEAKKLKKSLMGFDNLNILADNSDTSTGTGTGATTTIPTVDNTDTSAIDQANKKTSTLLATVKELVAIAKEGFFDGLNGKNAETTITNLRSIRTELEEIGKSAEATGAAKAYIESFVSMVSTGAGALTSMGITLVEFLTGSISQALSDRKEDIKTSIVSLFDIGSEINDIKAEWAKAVSNIFSVFSGENAIGAGSEILKIIYDIGEGVAEVGARITRDVYDLFTAPFINSQEEIKQALDGLLGAYRTVYSAISNVVRSYIDGIVSLYDEHLKPLFDNVTNGLSEIVGTIIDEWNVHMQPTIDELAAKIAELWEQYLQPIAHKLMNIVGDIIDIISALWGILEPIVTWIMSILVPVVSEALRVIGLIVLTGYETIAKVVDKLLTILRGITSFLRGIFYTDWKAVWNAVMSYFDAIGAGLSATASNIASNFINRFTSIKTGVVNIFNSLKTALKTPINGIITMLNKMISGINSIKVKIPSWVPSLGGKSLGFNLSKISLLAEGGYVKPNAPQLAMIGDNRHEGEIVAPESKLNEAVSSNVRPILLLLQQLMSLLVSQGGQGGGDITIPIYLDGKLIDEYVLTAADRKALRSGGMA